MGDMESFLATRGRHLGGVALLVLALVLGARFLVGAGTPSSPPPRRVVPLAGARVAPPKRLLVDVVGAVRRPGLYRLRGGARVADAVRLAGGVTRRADAAAVNLAAPLFDGTQVVVPSRGATAGAAASSGSVSAGPVRVSLNGATAEQLDALPGIGPVTAQKIVAYRTEHGSFHSVDDLDAIPGIGPARIAQLRDLVTP